MPMFGNSAIRKTPGDWIQRDVMEMANLAICCLNVSDVSSLESNVSK